MKTEVAEHLMRSWLRHIVKCQIAELNWKPSPQWSIGAGEIQKMMDSARSFFQGSIGSDIFGGTATATQLVQQGEIDVLGMQIGAQSEISSIYAVDVAFHEKGLNYGGRDETVARICKKMFRSAIIVKSYFGTTASAQIIFTSPKINESYLIPLQSAFKDMERFFSVSGLNYKISLVANDDFKLTVLNPVLKIARDVADTSELFIRSAQLLSLFDGGKVVPTDEIRSAKIASTKNQNSNDPLLFELEPSDLNQFKQRLLQTRQATIITEYTDGQSEETIWNAPNFSEDSNVIGNLRSRPQFRQGEWQRRGIARVRVKVA